VNPSSGTGRGQPRNGHGDGIGARDGDGDARDMAQLPLRIDFFQARSLLTDGDSPRRDGPTATSIQTARGEEGIPHQLILPTARRRALAVLHEQR
jgi:hypothetical protein